MLQDIPINKRKKRVPGPPKAVVELPKVEEKMVPIELPKSDYVTSDGLVWRRTAEGSWSCYDPMFTINNLELDFLVYSYLYYILDISLIPDNRYDDICKWLVGHREKEPEEFKRSIYYNLCKDIDETGSGFYLKEEDYPFEVKRLAVRFLNQKNKEVPAQLKGVSAYVGKYDNQ